ncbi:MAG TPA: hypothetical protein VFD88_08695 [Clostridia bacterium]|nr:hypothetical protein [Clostridia bacterium]
MSEREIEDEVRAALGETYRPAPALLRESMAAVRNDQPSRRALTWVAGAAAAVLAVGTVAVFVGTRNINPRPNPVTPISAALPQPVPQPITRTAPAAQVAWLSLGGQLVAVDPNGRVVAHVSEASAFTWRSADGSTIFEDGLPAYAKTVAILSEITAYSALDGKVQRTYPRARGNLIGEALSPDGHWLALLVLGTEVPPAAVVVFPTPVHLQLQVIDLRTGSSQLLPVGRDPNANLPGEVCPGGSCTGSEVWGMAIFAPGSANLYTLTDWGGPTRLSAFSLAGGKLTQTAVSGGGLAGPALPTCSGPAMAASITPDGHTLVGFCHFDGAVWFLDLQTMAGSGVIRAKQADPFAVSPIFTPDGHLLYLHQSPGFGDTMQVINLATRKLLGPFSTPTNIDQGGPFAWLITNVYAGGVASTVPLSPDGLKLYSATDDGIMVLRVPDLKPLAKLAPGFKASEVWVSGNGLTIYALSDDQKRVLVMHSDGSHQISVTLPSAASGFVASEHG